MVTTVGGVQIEIRGEKSQFDRTMREVQREAGRTGQVIEREFRDADGAATKLNNSIRATATSMAALALAVGVGSGLSQGIQLISGFSQSMSTLAAITQGTTAELVALEAVAKELGATTRFSATQAADAMGELARAGFTVTQVLAAIGPTLSAAQAGGAGIAETAAIIGATIGGFGLQATEAARIADVLAQAANGSAAGILDLGEALKFAAPTAKQLGLGLEETVAIIGKLSDGGITGGLAGRGFQSLATQFVNEKDKIEGLIGTYDLATDGLGNVLARLRQAGITTSQIIEIFRAENLDTFGILSDAALNGNLEKLNVLLNDAAGSSAKAAKVMDDNLNGAILNASSAFEGLVLALADAGVEDALRQAVDGLAALFTLAAENADVLGVAIVALAANAILPMAIRAVPTAIAALQSFGAAMIGVQTATSRAALLGGPLTLAITAIAAGYLILSRNAAEAREQIAKTNEVLDRADQILRDTQSLLGGGGSPFEQVSDQAGEAVTAVSGLVEVVDQLQTGLKNLRAEGQIATVFEIGQSIAEVQAQIAELEQARQNAIGRAVGNTPNLGGREGLQRIADRAAGRFDDSEQGQALLRARQTLAALNNRARVASQGLTLDDLVSQFRNGPAASAGATATEVTPEITAQAVATGELADETERLAAAQARIDQFNLGRAEANATGLAGAQQRIDEFNLNRAERDRAAQASAEAAQAFEDQIAASLARGLEDGIRSGNWGEAFRGILAESTSNALSEAINELASELAGLLSGLFSGGGFSLGSIFGGGRAAGGSVRAGTRYMVGEKGPEMFVPTVPGMIVPKFEGPTSAAAGGVPGAGGINITAPFIVQGSITEEVLPRVQAMMAQQARELPRIVDARVSDSLRRGRY